MNTNALNPRIQYGPNFDMDEAFNAPDVRKEEFPYMFISDALFQEYLSWTPEVAVGIIAQMGLGKNFFVENILIPDVLRSGERLLYINNRVALGRQTKRRLAKQFGMEEKLENYTDSGLDQLIEFGCLTVISFQQMAAWISENSPRLRILERDYKFVVVDEFQFFMSDCQFNAMTDLVMDFLFNSFRNSIRVFMTATPDGAFPLIKPLVTSAGPVYYQKDFKGYFSWHIYHFACTFEHCVPKAFKSMDDLADIIKKSDAKEKTIIFIENKDVGLEIIRKCGFGILLTADSKVPDASGYDTFKQIAANEKFEERLLVCTAVLENGVNIKDATVKRVVLFTHEKERFLQMLGRVRRLEGQQIDVLIPVTNSSEVSKQLFSLEKRLAALKLAEKNITAFTQQYVLAATPPVNVKGCFSVLANGQAHVNRLAAIKIERILLPFWKKIQDGFAEGDENILLREKFSWIQKEFSPEAILSGASFERALTNFIQFLEKYVGQEISKEQQEDFQKEFSERYRAVWGVRVKDKSSSQVYGLAVIREIFIQKQLPYKMNNENRSFWILEREGGDVNA